MVNHCLMLNVIYTNEDMTICSKFTLVGSPSAALECGTCKDGKKLLTPML